MQPNTLTNRSSGKVDNDQLKKEQKRKNGTFSSRPSKPTEKAMTRVNDMPSSTPKIIDYFQVIRPLNKNGQTRTRNTAIANTPSNKYRQGNRKITESDKQEPKDCLLSQFIQARVSASKANTTDRLKSLDKVSNVVNKYPRVKGKSGTLIIKTAKPTAKTVRPSLRTHQNFEAATCYKTRIDKSAVRPERTGFTSKYIDSNIEYKAHENTPAVQNQTTKHIKNRGKNRKQTLYQAKAVRPSLRTHQNFEAATRYKSRIIRNEVRTFRTLSNTNMTAVKTNLTAVKNRVKPAENVRLKDSNNMDSPQKARDKHVGRRRGVTKYIQSTFSKIRIGVTKYIQSTSSKIRSRVTKYKQSTFSKVRIRLSYKKIQIPRNANARMPTPNKLHNLCTPRATTYNLPHMVLGTKKGPDNA